MPTAFDLTSNKVTASSENVSGIVVMLSADGVLRLEGSGIDKLPLEICLVKSSAVKLGRVELLDCL